MFLPMLKPLKHIISQRGLNITVKSHLVEAELSIEDTLLAHIIPYFGTKLTVVPHGRPIWLCCFFKIGEKQSCSQVLCGLENESRFELVKAVVVVIRSENQEVYARFQKCSSMVTPKTVVKFQRILVPRSSRRRVSNPLVRKFLLQLSSQFRSNPKVGSERLKNSVFLIMDETEITFASLTFFFFFFFFLPRYKRLIDWKSMVLSSVVFRSSFRAAWLFQRDGIFSSLSGYTILPMG